MTTLAFLALALVTTPQEFDYSALRWEPLTRSNGVDVSRSKVPGSPILGVRVVATKNVHIGKIYELFRNVSRQVEWVNRLKKTYLISKPEDENPRYYSHYHSPWPVNDRDFVFQRKLHIDEDKKRITVLIHSVVDDRLPEKNCCVRGWLSRGYWRFTALPGNKTKIEVELFTDPKGLLPSWVINLLQKSWPVKSIGSLVARASKPDIPKTPKFADW